MRCCGRHARHLAPKCLGSHLGVELERHVQQQHVVLGDGTIMHHDRLCGGLAGGQRFLKRRDAFVGLRPSLCTAMGCGGDAMARRSRMDASEKGFSERRAPRFVAAHQHTHPGTAPQPCRLPDWH